MRGFDEYGLAMCRYQGELFAESLKYAACSTPVFLRRFMYSQTAARMDGNGFMFESLSVEDAIAEIEAEFGQSGYGKIRYGREELYWIGYIYRYWAYTGETSSRNIYKLVKPDELRQLYVPYHSLDPAAVVERIKEAKGLEEQNLIQRGVEILKRIRYDKLQCKELYGQVCEPNDKYK